MESTSAGKFGLRASLIGGFCILIALTIVVAILGIMQQRALHQRLNEVADNEMQLLIVASRMQSLNAEIGISVRDIVNTSNVGAQKESVKRLKAAQAKFVETLGVYKSYAETKNAAEKANADKLAATFEQTRLNFDEVLNLVDEADFDAARDSIFKKLRPVQQQVSDQLNEFQERLNSLADKSVTDAEAAYNASIGIMAGCVLAGIVAGLLIAFHIVRRVMIPVQKAKDLASRIAAGDLMTRADVQGNDELASLLSALNAMADQLRATVSRINEEAQKVAGHAISLQQGAESAGERSQTQVARMMEVASAVEEMTTSISEVSSSAAGVENAALEARRLIEEGNLSMDHNLAEIAQMVSNVESSQAIVRELNHELEQVNAITNVIKEIADQTNLLALNAAIEAARAGEQGRGFAVVADEVRKLAERTQKSTTEIGAMLGKIDQRANQAVSAMEQVRGSVDAGASDTREVGEKLHRILNAAVEVSTLVTTIAAATREQSSTSDLTARSIEVVSGLTEETDATVRSVAVTAEDMQAVSVTLQTLVKKFRV